MAPAVSPPGDRDPRPPPRTLRPTGQPPARPPDRGARPRPPLAEHERPQPGRRLRPPSRALPDLGGGQGCPDGGGRGRDQARWPEPDEGTPDPGDPGAAGGPARSGLARECPSRRGACVPDGPIWGRAQDRGRRPAVHLRAPGDTGRRAREAGGRPLGPLSAERIVRRGARRDARDHPTRGRLRAAHQPDPPRTCRLPTAPSLRRVRPAPDVPVVPGAQAGGKGGGAARGNPVIRWRAGPGPGQYAPARQMKRSTFVIFGIVVLLLGIGIPAWAYTHQGSQSSSPEDVPSNLQGGKDLFVTNCGACHTLAKAGTDGVIGPNLDELLAPPSASAPNPSTIKPRVLSAINNGVGGRMPKGVLSGQQADEVATFVAQVAGQGP